MSRFIKKKDVTGIPMQGHVTFKMLNETHGCVKGFCSGITVYTTTEYPTTGVHDDQEGFVVIEGWGWAKVGNEEMAIEPDTCFIAPAGTPHSIKKAPDSPDLKVAWFHGAV
jgi:mannose-6-phosphate isomerase-like protein (cupin superfamily)